MCCSGCIPDSCCTWRLLPSSGPGCEGCPGTLKSASCTVHILWNTMPPCIAQAVSLTAAAPAEYSHLPPALDVQGLQVHNNLHCVLYTYCVILFHHVLLRLPSLNLLHLQTSPRLLLPWIGWVSRYIIIGFAYCTLFLEKYSTMFCLGYPPDSYCTCRLLYSSSFPGWDGSAGTL